MNKTRAERFAVVRKASEDQKKDNFGGIYFTDKGKVVATLLHPRYMFLIFQNQPLCATFLTD